MVSGKQKLKLLNQDVLIQLRNQAVYLYKNKSVSCNKIADLLNVHRSTIYQWINKFKLKGEEGLKPGKSGRPIGKCRLLTQEQENQIRLVLVKKFPNEVGINYRYWSSQAVVEYLEKQFLVKVSVRTAGNYCKRWGLERQKKNDAV